MQVNSPYIVGLVILALAITAVLFGKMAFELALAGKDYAGFLTVASGAGGAIGALLAHTTSSKTGSSATVVEEPEQTE